MNHLGIDVQTRDVKKLMVNLKRLKTTHGVENGGVYWQDKSLSQVHITTTWTEDELDDWLYRVAHGCEYVGTFKITIISEVDLS